MSDVKDNYGATYNTSEHGATNVWSALDRAAQREFPRDDASVAEIWAYADRYSYLPGDEVLHTLRHCPNDLRVPVVRRHNARSLCIPRIRSLPKRRVEGQRRTKPRTQPGTATTRLEGQPSSAS